MATFSNRMKAKSRLYRDSLTQQDETIQINLRKFFLDNKKQLMVIQSAIPYQTIKDILKNLSKLGTNIKSKYSDPMCLTWEACETIVRTSKMILILQKLIILDYKKSDFGFNESKLLKTLLDSDSVESSTTAKIILVLSAETKGLGDNIESSLGEIYMKFKYMEKELVLKCRNKVKKGTSIIEAARLGNCYQVMHFIDNDVDIDMKDKSCNTALHNAAETGNTNIVLLLLKHGAAQLPDRNKTYPLHLACMNGSDDIVSNLIEYGANLEQDDKSNYTPLTYASINDHANVVETLLQYGAKIDGINSLKETALHVAARTKNLDAVKILIKNGANRNLLNNQNQTPAEVALAYKYQDIADYLNREEPQEGEHKELVKNSP